jgi:hypothetical protein
MRTVHLNVGASGSSPIVWTDAHRFELVRRTSDGISPRLLAYCVMDTHFHLVVRGDPDALEGQLRCVLAGYVRWLRKEHGIRVVLRDDVKAILVPEDSFEISRAIRYVHDNPVKARMVERAIDFPWSTQREYNGLSLAGHADRATARAITGREYDRCLAWRPEAADLVPLEVPLVHPAAILAAAAQTFGVLPEDMVARKNDGPLALARACYAQLGRLEGYHDPQLHKTLKRTRERTGQYARDVLPADAVCIARTLLRDPGLRAHLNPSARFPVSGNSGPLR